MSFMRNNTGNNSNANTNRNPNDAGEGLAAPFRPVSAFSTTEAEPAPAPDNLMERLDDARSPRVVERDPRTIPTPAERCVDVIAAGSKWKGVLNITDSVRIDGTVTGEVEAKGTIHISEGATVEAKLKAAFIVISGNFKGEVRCLEKLELLPKSKVQGDLETKALNVHEGATLDGTIRMTTDKAVAAAEGSERSSGRTNGARSSVAAEA
jgi:cytoskeletal protein CcmA (bactofilin family)